MAVDIKAKFTEAHSEVRSNTARSFAEGWTEAELSDKYLEPKGKWAGTTAQPERFHAIIANAPQKRCAAQGCTFYFPEEMSIESKKIVTDSELSENIAEQGTRRKPCRPAIQGGPAQPSPAKAAKDPKDPKPLTEGQKTNLRKSKHQWEAMLADYTKMMGDTDWEAEPYKSYTNQLLLKAATRAAEHATDQCILLDSIMDGAVSLSSEQFYGSAGEVKEKWKAVKDDVSKNSDKIWNLNRSLLDVQSTYDDVQAELEKKEV